MIQSLHNEKRPAFIVGEPETARFRIETSA